MRNTLTAFLLCCSLSPVALAAEHAGHAEADDVPIYEGAWTMRLGDHRAARLVVQDWEGTWQETGPANRAANPACRRKPYPISVHHSNTSEFEFTAWGSSVSPSCPDISFSVKPVDARTLAGTTASGDKVTMTRAPGKR